MSNWASGLETYWELEDVAREKHYPTWIVLDWDKHLKKRMDGWMDGWIE